MGLHLCYVVQKKSVSLVSTAIMLASQLDSRCTNLPCKIRNFENKNQVKKITTSKVMQSVRSLISWHSQPETFAEDRRVVWAGFCPSAPFLLRCQNSFHFSVALYTPTTRWLCGGVAHDWAGQLFDSLLANYSDHSIRNIDWFSVDREQTILEGLSMFLTAVLSNIWLDMKCFVLATQYTY